MLLEYDLDWLAHWWEETLFLDPTKDPGKLQRACWGCDWTLCL